MLTAMQILFPLLHVGCEVDVNARVNRVEKHNVVYVPSFILDALLENPPMTRDTHDQGYLHPWLAT
jgi:hypothetical protein